MTDSDTHPDIAAEIANGDMITLLDVARQFDVNPSTVLRWLTRGLPGDNGERIRLAGVRRGKLWLTSRGALQRFLGTLPHIGETPIATPIRTPSKRDRDSARAQANLRDKFNM